jgi:ABC-type uncharacterized transport system involved in gliding motility auxiliary subunit
MKPATKNILVKLAAGYIGLMALLALLIAVNTLLDHAPLRWDLTEERLFTLSPGTRDILRGLDRTVTLTLVFNASNPQIPGELRTFARRVEDQLRTFSMSSQGHIRIAKIDPQPDSDQEDWVQEHYGITPRALWDMENPIYLGIVVSCGNRQEKIAFVDPGREALLEYDLARLITRAARREKPVVAILSSLPVLGNRGMPPMMSNQGQNEAWIPFRQLQEDADVRELNPQAPVIPDDAKALIVVHPHDLAPETLFRIDQFVMRGGSCIVLVDPLCEAELAGTQGNQMAMMMGGPKGSSDLPPLLAAWGVTYDSGKLLLDQKAGTRLMMNQLQPEYQPFFLTCNAIHFNSKDILSAGLKLFQAPFAGALKVKPPEGVTLTPLITASPQSGLMETLYARMPASSALRKFSPDPEPLYLAVKLSGRFPSAYPDGQPKPADKDAAQATNEPPGTSLSRGITNASVIIVADVDFLHSQLCQYALGADEAVYGKPVQNAAFLVNAVEILGGNAALARIQARGKSLRPFARVQNLAYLADRQWQEQDNRLQNEIEKLRADLQKLDVRRGEQIEVVLSAEQEAAVLRFNKQIKALEKEQKAVRRKLREGIEKLGLVHKAFNILFTPLLVILGGAAYGWIKRRRKATI